MNITIIGGVDTHAVTHCAAAIDTSGRLLGVAECPANGVGYRRLVSWLRSHGTVEAIGIAARLVEWMEHTPAAMRPTLTPDRGSDMAGW